MKNKLIFYTFWLILLVLAPLSALSVTPWAFVQDDPGRIINLAQRLIGLWVYILLFIQIILGTFMPRLIKKYGAWIFKFHIFEGVLIFLLIILHPLAFTVFNYLAGKGFDPLYAYIDVCVLCDGITEFFYNFGRIGFWLVTVGVVSGLFRAATPFMRLHWRKFHIVNYVAFFFIWFHSLKLGLDIGTPPFSFFHGPAVIVISAIVIFKVWNFYRISRD